MATIVDALVVTLGLDPKGFKQGSAEAEKSLKQTSEASDKAAKQMEANGKKAAQFFGNIKVEALSLLAIFTAGMGLKEFATKTMSSAQQLQNLSSNLGQSASEVKAWEGVFTRAGGSAQDATALFSRAADEIGKLKSGQGVGQALQAIGMSGGSIGEAMKGPREMVMEEARVLEKLNAIDPLLARSRAQMMGLSDAQFSVMKQGPAALEAQMAAQKKLNGLNDEQIARLGEMNAKWADFKAGMEGVATSMLASLAPALDMVISGLQQFSLWASEHGPAIKAFFVALAVGVAVVMAPVLDMLAAMAVAAAVAAAPFVATAAAIAAVAAAIGYVYEQWTIWIDGGKSSLGGFFQFFADVWGRIKTGFAGTVNALKTLFGDYVTAIKDELGLIYQLFFGTSDQIRAAWAKLVGDFKKIGADIVALLKTVASNAVDAFTDGFKQAGPAVLDALKSALGSAFEWVEGRVKTIWNLIRGKHDDSSPQAPAPAPAPANNQAPADAPAAAGGASASSAPAKSKSERLAEAWAAAKKSEAKYGIPAAVTMAQWALESSWGKKMSGANNPFGIKAKKGESGTDVMTHEVINGKRVMMNQRFANYDSLDAAFEAHAKLLATAHPYAAARAHKNDAGAFADQLSGVYATDPNYGSKLRQIMAGMDSARNGGGAARGGASSSSEVNIQQMTIQTAATDASGIAKDAQAAFQKHPLIAPQANTGLG